MPHGMTILGETGLRFFGKMSAANAHEIKNALAVINESAGLLGDLVALSAKGIPLDPDRLKRLADKIKEQVARADEIAKSTNRFAHSVDKAHGPADLKRSLVLVKTMAMRFATKRHITIEIVPCKAAITLQAPPFILLHLLWLCLQCAMRATDAEKTLQVIMERKHGDALVRYGPLSHLEASKAKALNASPAVSALLRPLKGQVKANANSDELVLTFSRQEAPGERMPIKPNK